MVPFGLTFAAPVPDEFTASLPGVKFDPALQVSTHQGQPVVTSDLPGTCEWTWGDTKQSDS